MGLTSFLMLSQHIFPSSYLKTSCLCFKLLLACVPTLRMTHGGSKPVCHFLPLCQWLVSVIMWLGHVTWSHDLVTWLGHMTSNSLWYSGASLMKVNITHKEDPLVPFSCFIWRLLCENTMFCPVSCNHEAIIIKTKEKSVKKKDYKGHQIASWYFSVH